jgi:hypothetical protein
MRTQSDTKIVVEPDTFEKAHYPATLLYQSLIDQGVAPVKWKEGKAPKGRDAKESDLETSATLRIRGNEIVAMW